MIAYQKKHGQLKFTIKSSPAATRIHEWMKMQRKARPTMKKDRIKKLDSVGFEWKPDVFNAAWDEKFAMYRDFVKMNGIHCIPQKKSLLSMWISLQRTLNTQGRMKEDRRNKLNRIGFLWKAVSNSERTEPKCLPWFAEARGPKPSQAHAARLNEVWNSKYEALIAHKNRVGHCTVSRTVDVQLKGWCDQQRKLRRKGRLARDREKKLDAIGFHWPPCTTVSMPDTWECMFRRLESFKRRFGHLIVSRGPHQNEQLHVWIEKQRQEVMTIHPDRRAQLDELGFCWTVTSEDSTQAGHDLDDANGRVPRKLQKEERNTACTKRKRVDTTAPPIKRQCGEAACVQTLSSKNSGITTRHSDLMPSDRDSRWEKGFREMIAYQKKHGQLKFTIKSSPAATRIHEWMKMQRKARPTMKKDRIKKLDSVGFEWKPDVFNAAWDEKFAMYRDFVKMNGIHCIPQKKSLLSMWISLQRTLNTQGRMKEDRRNKLNRIGFLWKAVSNSERTEPKCLPWFAEARGPKPSQAHAARLNEVWNSKYEALIAHKNRVGHCTVSRTVDVQLKGWCDQQRKLRRKGRLARDREKKLDAIGFHWPPCTTVSMPDTWECMFRRLESFKRRFGHLIVSRGPHQNEQLHVWIEKQRQEVMTIHPDRRAQLDELGFCWTVTSEDSTQAGHDLDDANGRVPRKLQKEERRVLSTHSMSTSRTKCKRVETTRPRLTRHCVRVASNTLDHVPMLGTPPVDNAIVEPIPKKGCDHVNKSRLRIKSNTVEQPSALVDDVVASDRDDSLEVPHLMIRSKSEREQEESLKITSGCGFSSEKMMLKKTRRTERGFREREILIGRMKIDEFAPDSVAHKVMARLLAKLTRKT